MFVPFYLRLLWSQLSIRSPAATLVLWPFTISGLLSTAVELGGLLPLARTMSDKKERKEEWGSEEADVPVERWGHDMYDKLQQDEEEVERGLVVRLTGKGFGFLRCAAYGLDDLFFRTADVSIPGKPPASGKVDTRLNVGDDVEFCVRDDKEGRLQAYRIRRLPNGTVPREVIEPQLLRGIILKPTAGRRVVAAGGANMRVNQNTIDRLGDILCVTSESDATGEILKYGIGDEHPESTPLWRTARKKTSSQESKDASDPSFHVPPGMGVGDIVEFQVSQDIPNTCSLCLFHWIHPLVCDPQQCGLDLLTGVYYAAGVRIVESVVNELAKLCNKASGGGGFFPSQPGRRIGSIEKSGSQFMVK